MNLKIEMAIGPQEDQFLNGFMEGHNFPAKSWGRVKFLRLLMWTNIEAPPPPPPP